MHYGGGDHYTADLGCIILQIKARGRGLGPQLVVCSPGLSVAHKKTPLRLQYRPTTYGAIQALHCNVLVKCRCIKVFKILVLAQDRSWRNMRTVEN